MKDETLTAKRKRDIDIAKGSAMLLVILGHTVYTPKSVVWWLYSFHMPLFFSISGIVFHPQKYLTWTQFLIAKIKSLLLPYFCLCSILWFWVFILQNKSGFINEETLNGFCGIFLGFRLTKYYLSMWFVLVLFVSEVILYALYRYCSRKREGFLFIFLILSLLGWGILQVWKKGFFWSLDIVPICLSFLILGYCIKLYEKELSNYYKIHFFYYNGSPKWYFCLVES